MKAAAPAGRPPSSGAPSSSSSLGGVRTPGFRPGCPSWKEGSGVRSAPRVQEARQRPHPRRVPWGAVRAGRGPHSSHALPGAGRSETGPGCGATRSSQVWASASRVPAFQTFPPAVLLATLGGTEGGRSGPCSLGTGTQNPRARAGGDRGLGVSGGGGEHFAGQLASGRRDSRAAGFAGGGRGSAPAASGSTRRTPPPRLGRLRQVTWHILLEAGFRLGFQGLLASLGPSAARDPSVAEVAVSQPGRCHGPPRLPQTAVPIHTDSVPAFSPASPTPAFRAAGGATSLAASLLSQLSLSGRVRAQQVPRGWALLPRAARLCARGNDAGPETRPLRVRVTCVRGPLTSQPRPGPATPDTLGATKSEHEPRLSRTLWGREKKKKKDHF